MSTKNLVAIKETDVRTIIIASIAVLASLPVFADIVRHSGIPNALWGTWAVNAEACQQDSKSSITLSEKAYGNSDLQCIVDWVSEMPSGQGPVYSARLLCSPTKGSGEKTPSNVVLLSKANNQLSIGTDIYNLKIHQRCSPADRAKAR